MSPVPQTTPSTHPQFQHHQHRQHRLHHQHHHQIPGSTKDSPRPKWLLHFLKLKYGMGEACPMALSQLLRGCGQGTGPRTAPPGEIKESGLENFTNQSWHSPCPCPRGQPRPPNLLSETCQAGSFSPHTPPKRGSKTKKGNNLLTQRCPGEGGADKWDPPPQTGLAQGEFPNPPEQTPTQSGEGQCLEAEKSWDQAGFPPGVEFLCCAAPTSLLRQQSPGWERDRGLHSSALHLLLWILTCWSHRSSGKLVGQRVPPGPRKLEGRTSAQGGASTPAPAGSCWVLGGGSLPCN